MTPSVRQPVNPVWPDELNGRVVFDGVSFSYPDGVTNAISGLRLEIEPYTTTALVGFSGCGKTTLMKLLQRTYDTCQGSIRIDSIDLRDLDYNRYRREAVGVVDQDVELFDDTIFNNIRVTDPDATDEQVFEAARLAYANEFIDKLPQRYNTMIGEDGIRLSGGQRQRLAIARALLRKPNILIMDEATSALDSVSQQYIHRTINDLIQARTCTIFIIAHRLSTTRGAHKVAVLDDGQLAQFGTHQQLLAQEGLYKRLCDGESEGLLD